ncbi:signal peptide peptidase SppA [Staphylococcus arlettae]|uniref:signal peptide peptidase SppA n=1 Tax=Staphylococcus arlettae TaxID=29378 RepID=UPI00028240DF|nr:signal peptide peptidase SppA [Staphylococcus arlettae]EJY95466.1 protease [Staphylococcus arlettae CVD059]MDT3894562.1 signal peptide peptidase SppA [Staphylococcus arlettae]
MSKKRIVAIILAAVIVIGGIVMSSIAAVVGSFVSDSADMNLMSEEVESEGDSAKRIAHLTLNGQIMEGSGGGLFSGEEGYNHDLFLKELDSVKEDNTVKGVLLTVNTPGGGTYPSDEIYKKIQQLKQSGKKVYVHMESMAASGGYYISAPADKIYAGPQTMTGSIGVIMSNIDYSELQENLGIKENVIKSGAHKDIMSGSREMTDEEKDIMQSMLDDSFDRFVNIVKDGRNMSEEKVRKLADGRLYSAQQAEKNGLIDDIAYEDETIKALKKDIKAKDAEVFKYNGQLGVFGSLYSAKTAASQLSNQLEDVKAIFTNNTDARPMYLYEG